MQEYAHEYAERWIHETDSFDMGSGLFLLHMGHNIAKPDYSNGPRQKAHYTIHFVREGRLQFLYGGSEVELGKGDMFCMFPHTSYTYRVAPSDDRLKMIWFAINGSQVPDLMMMAGFTPEQPCQRKVVDPDLESILHQMIRLPKSLSKKHLVLWSSLMYRIFSKLIPDQEPAPAPRTPDVWLRKSLDFIHTCYAEPITVNDIAAYVNIHRTHFSKTFTEHVGIPPVKYLQNIRLGKAAQLLKQTSLSVTEIALTVGYPDLFSFTRAFTRQYGVSPSRVRYGG
ncbi:MULTISPECIES: AraC family transcriptional regulator [unclassified Paenibacillus]|uniref:AraC family transcriptional regulator n=1 Tax=unclassified Paenibacillus TaxID=185978 RepID=UPI0009AC07B3|nr:MULTISPECIES: AraC family transcriptional regulator [unclassified Paenibacillus]MBE1444786.1 AraC-like DNA-binding protein [Paenibacillus sp. OAS669]